MLHNVYLEIPIVLIEVPLKVTIAHFVTIFKFAEVLTLFLNGVISQVDKFIVKIIQAEFSTTCTYVAIFVEVCFELLIYRGDQRIHPEVELSLMYQKRIINIPLNDGCAVPMAIASPRRERLDFMKL